MSNADELILMPIYGAGEENTYDVSSEKLAEEISKTGKTVKVCNNDEIEKIVRNNDKTGKTYIFMGAGSVSKLAHEIKEKLK